MDGMTDWTERRRVAESLLFQKPGCENDKNLIMALLILQIDAIKTIKVQHAELDMKALGNAPTLSG